MLNSHQKSLDYNTPRFGACNAKSLAIATARFWCANGRLIFIHHQCWEVLSFCCFQRQRCIKILCPKDPDFYTPLALKTAKGQHLPALVNAHSSTPTPVFLTSREETQTMVREKLGPKPRPRQTLDLPGKGETQTMV